jgi:hypothetical protein
MKTLTVLGKPWNKMNNVSYTGHPDHFETVEQEVDKLLKEIYTFHQSQKQQQEESLMKI